MSATWYVRMEVCVCGHLRDQHYVSAAGVWNDCLYIVSTSADTGDHYCACGLFEKGPDW